jgi:butyryl-CoA dehydrogenase
MLATMCSLTHAARALCYATAEAIDRSQRCEDAAERNAASERAAVLTPVAKAFATDVAVEVASLGIQIHGGMGFVEETGAAQHLRDARILPIYEGTNGVQAIDLVTRKLPLSDGETVLRQIEAMSRIASELADVDSPSLQAAARPIAGAVDSLERATRFMLGALADNATEDTPRPRAPTCGCLRRRTAARCSGDGSAAQRAMTAGDTITRTPGA